MVRDERRRKKRAEAIGLAFTASHFLPQLQPIHHVVRGDRFDRLVRVLQLSAERRDLCGSGR